MVFRLPSMTIIFSEKKHISPVLHSFCLGWRRVRSVTTISRLKGFKSNHFGKERRDGKRTLAKKNFPSPPSCPLPEFCSSDGFYSGTVSNNYFLARKNEKEICPTSSFLMNVLKGNHRHFVFGAFSEENLSQWCVMMIAGLGKVLSKTNLLVN